VPLIETSVFIGKNIYGTREEEDGAATERAERQ
jgi:hypothetical protein